MFNFISSNYLLFKGLHALFSLILSIGIICIASIFSFRYKALTQNIVQLQKIRRKIVTPFLIIVVFIGILLISANPGILSGQGWLHAKLTLVVIYFGLYGFYVKSIKKVEKNEQVEKLIFFRILLGLTVFIPGFILILAYLKPF